MNMLTGTQIRAARAMLRISAQDLANLAEIGITTIRRAESVDGQPKTTTANLKAIKTALETAGVEFIPENGGGAGVRLRK